MNSPAGSGLKLQMQEKHYDFWLYAWKGEQRKPGFEIKAITHQKAERVIMSLSEFALGREPPSGNTRRRSASNSLRSGSAGVLDWVCDWFSY